MREAYCRWHNKLLRDVAEHEQEECGGNCSDCEDMVPGKSTGEVEDE